MCVYPLIPRVLSLMRVYLFSSAQMMLSISRLCFMAKYQKGEVDPNEPIADAISNGLDFVAVQQGLLAKFQELLEKRKPNARQRSIESNLDVIVDTTAHNLTERPRHLRVRIVVLAVPSSRYIDSFMEMLGI